MNGSSNNSNNKNNINSNNNNSNNSNSNNNNNKNSINSNNNNSQLIKLLFTSSDDIDSTKDKIRNPKKLNTSNSNPPSFSIEFNSYQVTDSTFLDQVLPLLPLENAIHLTFFGSDLNTDTLEQVLFQCSRLERLRLIDCCNVSKNIISALSRNCPKIRDLSVVFKDYQSQWAKSKEKTISELVRSFSHELNKLTMRGFLHANDPEVAYLVECFSRSLVKLDLSKCPLLTDDSLSKLSQKCGSLTELAFNSNNITDAGVIALVNGCSRLKKLDLRNCPQVSDVSVEEISNRCSKRLEKLFLGGCHLVTGKAMVALCRFCPRLAILSLERTAVKQLSPLLVCLANLQRIRISRQLLPKGCGDSTGTDSKSESDDDDDDDDFEEDDDDDDAVWCTSEEIGRFFWEYNINSRQRIFLMPETGIPTSKLTESLLGHTVSSSSSSRPSSSSSSSSHQPSSIESPGLTPSPSAETGSRTNGSQEERNADEEKSGEWHKTTHHYCIWKSKNGIENEASARREYFLEIIRCSTHPWHQGILHHLFEENDLHLVIFNSDDKRSVENLSRIWATLTQKVADVKVIFLGIVHTTMKCKILGDGAKNDQTKNDELPSKGTSLSPSSKSKERESKSAGQRPVRAEEGTDGWTKLMEKKRNDVFYYVRESQTISRENIKREMKYLSSLASDSKIAGELMRLKTLSSLRADVCDSNPIITFITRRCLEGHSDDEEYEDGDDVDDDCDDVDAGGHKLRICAGIRFLKKKILQMLDSIRTPVSTTTFKKQQQTTTTTLNSNNNLTPVRPITVELIQVLMDLKRSGQVLMRCSEFKKLLKKREAFQFLNGEDVEREVRQCRSKGLLMDFEFKSETSEGFPMERFLSPNPLKFIQLLCKFHLSAHDQSDFIVDVKRFWPRGGGLKPPLPQTLLAAVRNIFIMGVVKENLFPILLGDFITNYDQLSLVIELCRHLGLLMILGSTPDAGSRTTDAENLIADSETIDASDWTVFGYEKLSSMSRYYMPLTSLNDGRRPGINWSSRPVRGDLQITWRFEFPNGIPFCLKPALVAAVCEKQIKKYQFKYIWSHGVFYKIEEVYINIEMESKRLDIAGRINAEELEDPKMASELLWCHIAPIILATFDLMERVWPGIFVKVSLVPAGSLLFFDSVVSCEKSFSIFYCFNCLCQNSAVKFLDDGIEREVDLKILLPYDVNSFQTVRDWLKHLVFSRSAVFSMAEAFLKSESETVSRWNVSVDEKLISKMKKRKNMKKFQCKVRWLNVEDVSDERHGDGMDGKKVEEYFITDAGKISRNPGNHDDDDDNDRASPIKFKLVMNSSTQTNQGHAVSHKSTQTNPFIASKSQDLTGFQSSNSGSNSNDHFNVKQSYLVHLHKSRTQRFLNLSAVEPTSASITTTAIAASAAKKHMTSAPTTPITPTLAASSQFISAKMTSLIPTGSVKMKSRSKPDLSQSPKRVTSSTLSFCPKRSNVKNSKTSKTYRQSKSPSDTSENVRK